MTKLIMDIRLIFFLISASTALQCMDENNSPVDWFVVYKFPTLKGSENLFSSGVAYSYMTSDSFSSWKLSTLSINNTNSIIGRTLFNLYNENSKFFSVLYNDQPPEGSSNENKGHNKGVVQADSKGGFWLVHSVPHFPYTSDYMYPKSGTIYGQSFLCISLDIANLNKVGIQLQYNQPQVYSKNALESLKSSLPELFKAANNVTNKNAPFYHISGISSKQGVEFTSFAKSKEFKKDLYEDLVAPYLKTDLFVESWLNGAGKLQSDCSKTFKVKNIQQIDFKSFSKEFRTSEDHSKWAVSPPTASKTWICIGDINRMAHQLLRGGGTVCLNNKQLVTDYQKVIASVEECSKNN